MVKEGAVSVVICEVRPDDSDDLAALLRDSGQGEGGDAGSDPLIDPAGKPRCESILSLVAREGGALVGAILCFHDGQMGYRHRVAVRPSHQDGVLARTLIDKALHKLINQGAKRCRISLPGEAQHDPFWEVVKWGDRPQWREPDDSTTMMMERFKAQHGVPVEPAEPTGGDVGSAGADPQDGSAGLSDTATDHAPDAVPLASDQGEPRAETGLDAQPEPAVAEGAPVSA